MKNYIDITDRFIPIRDEFQLNLEEYQEINFLPIIFGVKKTDIYPEKIKSKKYDIRPYRYRHYMIISFTCNFKKPENDPLWNSYEDFIDVPDFDSMLVKRITGDLKNTKVRNFEPFISLS